MHVPGRQNTEGFKVVGINYKKSDASVRGVYAVNHDQYKKLLETAANYGVSDFFILSTCNRTEIYGFADTYEQLIEFICSAGAGSPEVFSDISYAKKGVNAITHLYHVAAGIDSQILGDYEILGQIKCAVKFAKANGYIGLYMERLVNSVLQASKAVKTHTELSGGTVSVSFAAIQYIREYLSAKNESCEEGRRHFDDYKIVLIGTGKIGRITCRNMVDYLGTKNITLINRTETTAVKLAGELGLRSAPLAGINDEIASADIVVVSTNATTPVVLERHVNGKGQKLVIDISVPCNVAAEAQRLDSVTFVDVDMLSKIKDETLQKRKAEVPKALSIITEHIDDFIDWCDMRKHVPVLKEVKSKLMAIPLNPVLLSLDQLESGTADSDHEERVHRVIKSLATRMRKDNTPGCHYIQAINDFIA